MKSSENYISKINSHSKSSRDKENMNLQNEITQFIKHCNHTKSNNALFAFPRKAIHAQPHQAAPPGPRGALLQQKGLQPQLRLALLQEQPQEALPLPERGLRPLNEHISQAPRRTLQVQLLPPQAQEGTPVPPLFPGQVLRPQAQGSNHLLLPRLLHEEAPARKHHLPSLGTTQCTPNVMPFLGP